MSLDEQVPQTAAAGAETAESSTSPAVINKDEEIIARERSEKLTQAKELYSNGSRNFLVKNYADAADELSRVCALYSELHGEFADELGMPFLLYAKSLIALSLDENKVVDVPDEEADDDDDDEDDEEENEKEEEAATANNDSEVVSSNSNGKATVVNGKNGEADSSVDAVAGSTDKEGEDALVSSTVDGKTANGKTDGATIRDDEKPSTSNGVQHMDTEDLSAAEAATVAAAEEENDAATNLQLAWEILETAAKIFSRQGANGLPNLAEVQCELGNIQFENCILDAARNDYEKSLKIYYTLEQEKYRRAMAEIHYKIGLSYLMEQKNKEGAASLKEACQLIQGEIDEIKAKEELSEKDKNNIQDMEETKQEIEAKIVEIEEMQAQQIAAVRAALDSYIKPIMANAAAEDNEAAAGSSSTAATTSATSSATAADPATAATAVPQKKANDISHLIKRKKPEGSSEAEAASPAKRAAL